MRSILFLTRVHAEEELNREASRTASQQITASVKHSQRALPSAFGSLLLVAGAVEACFCLTTQRVLGALAGKLIDVSAKSRPPAGKWRRQ